MLCVLFDKGQSEVTLVDFLRRMVDYFWIYSVQVGVSFPFADITQVRDYANQAEVALETVAMCNLLRRFISSPMSPSATC